MTNPIEHLSFADLADKTKSLLSLATLPPWDNPTKHQKNGHGWGEAFDSIIGGGVCAGTMICFGAESGRSAHTDLVMQIADGLALRTSDLIKYGKPGVLTPVVHISQIADRDAMEVQIKTFAANLARVSGREVLPVVVVVVDEDQQIDMRRMYGRRDWVVLMTTTAPPMETRPGTEKWCEAVFGEAYDLVPALDVAVALYAPDAEKNIIKAAFHKIRWGAIPEEKDQPKWNWERSTGRFWPV